MKKSPKAIMATVSILAGSIAGVNLLPGASASALCDGKNDPYVAASAIANGAESVRLIGTCDGLKDYYGQYLDIKTDGAAVYIKYRKNGVWKTTPANGSGSNWMAYSYTDSNSNSATKICNTKKVCGGVFDHTGF